MINALLIGVFVVLFIAFVIDLVTFIFAVWKQEN